MRRIFYRLHFISRELLATENVVPILIPLIIKQNMAEIWGYFFAPVQLHISVHLAFADHLHLCGIPERIVSDGLFKL